jgi:DNA-binding CsgD family transcriptional regulator
MDRRIIVIHHSDLLRKGIVSIIRTSCQYEVIELSSLEELQDYTKLSNLIIVLVVQESCLLQGAASRIEPLKKKNIVKLIGITTGDSDKIPVYPVDERMDINVRSDVLLSRIAHLAKNDMVKNKPALSAGLTDREQEVLKLVALGYINKEIADTLSISIHTVISHRKNIVEKLGIRTISGLTVYAVINGMVDIDQIRMG